MNAPAPQIRQPDRNAKALFLATMFRHAEPDTYIAFRAFLQKPGRGMSPTVALDSVKAGAADLIDRAMVVSIKAANVNLPAASYVPLATFRTGESAKTANLAQGLVLSAECDDAAQAALVKAKAVLGPATVVVTSGGMWTDPLGLEHPKLHLHWRLARPAVTREALAMLAEARSLLRQLIGGDPTCDPIVHPLRLPGSWHRKEGKAPTLVVMESCEPDVEIELEVALAALRQAVPNPEMKGQDRAAVPENLRGEDEDITALAAVIPNDDLDWRPWNDIVMAFFAASDGYAYEAAEAWSAKSSKHDPEQFEARWDHFGTCPPDRIGMGTLIHLATKAKPGWISPSLRRRSEMKLTERHFDQAADQAVSQTAEPSKPSKPKKKREPQRRGANDTRPVITVRAGDIEAVVDAMEAALIARGGFYQRAGSIVGIGEVPMITAGEQEATAIRVVPKGKYAIAEAVSSAACMMKYDARCDDDVVINPPLQLVETLMDRVGKLRLPPLAGIITAPTLRPDGSVLEVPGYDRATGLYFEPGDERFPTIQPRPSRAEAEAALALLGDVIQHFPFVAAEDRSVALSAMMTGCVRQSIPTAPMHGFTAPVRGSGKSKLADVVSVIVTGRPAAVVAQHADDAEMEKRLSGMLLQGAQIIAIDNCVVPIDGAFLDAMMSQSIVTVRPLGGSRMVDVPSGAFVMAGGNGLVVSGDMTRRTVLCSLDPRMERPETRRFDFEPVARAKAERGCLVAAVLTILLAHRAAGSPQQGVPLGSFEQWSRLVRDALVWLGCADPLLTMAAIQEDDPEKAELDAVLTKWAEKIGQDRITVSQLIERMASYDSAQFRADLLAIAGTGGTINGRRLGKWLGRQAKRRSGGRWIEQAGLSSGNVTWQLRTA